MIEVENVSRVYNEGRPNEVRALNDVTLRIPDHAVTVLKGPSGSGKTTLLSLIGCLARPTSGRILLDGEIISALPEHFMAKMRRERFGFVFQRFHLIRGLSVVDNVMLPAYPAAPDYRELRERAMAALRRLRLEHRAGMKVELLSGGETQRVAIARALINDPEWVLADEPTANLDSALVEQLLEEIRMLKADGKSLVITTHDPRIIDSDVVDVVAEMRDGKITSVTEVER